MKPIIDYKDKVMVRFYAFFHIVEYRNKVLTDFIIFLTAIITLYEVVALCCGTKLDIIDLLVFIGSVSVFTSFLYEKIQKRKAKNHRQETR